MRDNKIYKPIIVANKEIIAPLDIANDINLIRTTKYVELRSPPLIKPKIRCKGHRYLPL